MRFKGEVMESFDFSTVRGFNYQPSAGSTSFENWYYFRPDLFELELRRGKQYFSRFNTVRYWLSWDAFIRKPLDFADHFEKALKIADSLGLKVMPCLFNRWHNEFCDAGGLYLDNIIPGYGWGYRPRFYKEYLDAIVGEHKNDKRVLLWDLCNEPFSYRLRLDQMGEIPGIEYAWLKEMYNYIKAMPVSQYVSFSPWPGKDIFSGLTETFAEWEAWNEKMAAIMDVIVIHPYYIGDQSDTEKKAFYEKMLDSWAALGEKQHKGVLASETCWGSLDDQWRVENIRYTMAELKKRKIGIIPHALHHSLVADLHLPEFGPVGPPGDLRFINADGTLRKGHEVYNEF
jgi:hypothetical protein